MVTKSAGKKGSVEESENTILQFLRSKGIKATKTVDSAVWTWIDGEPKYFKVLSAPVRHEKRGNSAMEPATVCKVTDLETGNHYTLILNTVLLSSLTANYAGEAIVGKCFVSCRSANTKGKAYKDFETYEVPDPEE